MHVPELVGAFGMKPSAKDTAALVIGIGKPKGEPMSMDEEESEDEGMGDKEMAASEVMDALKAGDARAFGSALESFIQICSGYED
jgi:hypothetical protein